MPKQVKKNSTEVVETTATIAAPAVAVEAKAPKAKAAKKVAVLSKALKKAESEEKKAVIVKKLSKARKHLKKATKKVQKVFAGSKSKHNPADDLTSDTE